MDNSATQQYEAHIAHHRSTTSSGGGHLGIPDSNAHVPVTPTPYHHLQLSASNNAAVAAATAVAVAQQQQYNNTRSHQAYKRPMPPSAPSKLHTTIAPAYSPRSTPPCKIPALQRVLSSKAGGIYVADLSDGASIAGALTPPATPDVTSI